VVEVEVGRQGELALLSVLNDSASTAVQRVGTEPVRDKVDQKVEPRLLPVVLAQFFDRARRRRTSGGS
jgi:hypothetical protein